MKKSLILVLGCFTTCSISSISISCFSYPLFDLPSFGLSSEAGLFVNSDANILTNVGANNKTLNADFCFFAIASVLVLEVFPSLISSQGSKFLRRISPAIDTISFLPNLSLESESNSPVVAGGPTLPEPGHTGADTGNIDYTDIMPGTRRLDMDVAEYEYVDTNPSESMILGTWYDNSKNYNVPGLVDSIPNNELHVSSHLVHTDPNTVSNSLVHSVSYAVNSDPNDSWSAPMSSEDEFSWSVQQYDNSVDSAMMGDSRLTQDYDDIDYTSGNMVSFHTSIAR